jgi:hypothetical protein
MHEWIYQTFRQIEDPNCSNSPGKQADWSTQPSHQGNFAKTIFKLAAVLGEVAHNVLELNVGLSGGVVPAEKRRRPLQQSKNDVGQELRKSKKG